MSVSIEFILDTGADAFANWLLATWRAPDGDSIFPTDKGSAHLQGLRDERAGRLRTLRAGAVWVLHRNERGNQEAYDFEDVAQFKLLPLSPNRTEVRVQANILFPGFVDYLIDVLETIAARWPELRASLKCSLNLFPYTEKQQVEYSAIETRLRNFKAVPESPAPPPVPLDALKLSVMLTANTSTRHMATRLKTVYGRIGGSSWLAHDCDGWPDRLKDCTEFTLFPADFVGPADDLSAVLSLILETKAKDTEPFLSTAIRFRLGEISPYPAKTSCDILCCLVGRQALRTLGEILKKLFRELPDAAQTVEYFPHFWPERELPDHLEESYYEFTTWLESKGGQSVSPLDLLWGYDHEVENLRKRPARDEPAAVITGEPEANGQPARDDLPVKDQETDFEEDEIRRYGRRRDLSTNEVKAIVRRCKKYRDAGGSMAQFHEKESATWDDPDDWPKSYSEKTLQSWMKNERFQ